LNQFQDLSRFQLPDGFPCGRTLRGLRLFHPCEHGVRGGIHWCDNDLASTNFSVSGASGHYAMAVFGAGSAGCTPLATTVFADQTGGAFMTAASDYIAGAPSVTLGCASANTLQAVSTVDISN
jgi:hypothetical protein